MAFCVQSAVKTVRESKGEAADLPVAHCCAIVRQAVLVHYHVVEWHLTCYSPDDIAAAIWSYAIISCPKVAAPEEQLMVRQRIHYIWRRYRGTDVAT